MSAARILVALVLAVGTTIYAFSSNGIPAILSAVVASVLACTIVEWIDDLYEAGS